MRYINLLTYLLTYTGFELLIVSTISPMLSDALLAGDQFGRMGQHHVLRAGLALVLGLDLFRVAHCRKYRYFFYRTTHIQRMAV